jgi:hypothetical protein
MEEGTHSLLSMAEKCSVRTLAATTKKSGSRFTRKPDFVSPSKGILLLTPQLDPLQLLHPSLRGPAMLRIQLFSNFQVGDDEPSLATLHSECL